MQEGPWARVFRLVCWQLRPGALGEWTSEHVCNGITGCEKLLEFRCGSGRVESSCGQPTLVNQRRHPLVALPWRRRQGGDDDDDDEEGDDDDSYYDDCYYCYYYYCYYHHPYYCYINYYYDDGDDDQHF
jgi:hypothetical protein